VPDWFRNNIDWVKSGHITQQEFRTAYNYLVDQQIAHPPEENLTITDNMVTQQVINFNIVNGRAVGSIRFVATNNFNPYYYNKNIVNIIQIKDPNGANILTTVKQNTLNFTETEREEMISYDEDVKQNTRATVESFVWTSATAPTAFSKKYTIDISETEPPKPITSGFMGAGIAGAIAGLVLIGFIADHKSHHVWRVSRLVNTCQFGDSGVLRECGSSAPFSPYLALCISSIWLALSYILL